MKLMKLFFSSFLVLGLVGMSILLSSYSDSSPKNKGSQSSKIEWTTDFEDALKQSQATSKPIVLFFTGSDWCGWCTKLEEESLNTKDFIEATKGKFIFVKLDYPLYAPLDAKIQAQNKKLQTKYAIKGFPTLILIDGQQNLIGTTGYVAGGGKKYAKHLQSISDEFYEYKKKSVNIDEKKLSSADIQKLYEKAEEFHDTNEMQKLLAVGLSKDTDNYFHIEQYRLLAEEGLIHTPQAIALKSAILVSDPANTQKAHYNVAVIEFEAFSKEMEKENYSPDIALAPLKEYVEKFGSVDKENLWRIQMLISQVYLSKQKWAESLKYAQASQKSAPQAIQQDIVNSIAQIQKRINQDSVAASK